MSKVKVTCKQCGGGFEVYLSQIKIGEGKYCSKKCYGLSRIAKVKKKCEHCGGIFEVKPYDIKREKGKYCSPKCQHAGCTTRFKKKCEKCGGEFEVQVYRIKEGNGKYCSKKCYLDSRLPTGLEMRGREILNDLGLEFKEQYQVDYYIADIFISEFNLVIEWDGDYWHSTEKGIAQDKRKNKYYTKQGFNVLRFREKDVYNDPQSVIDEIVYNTTPKAGEK